MTTNRISAEFSESDCKAVLDAIALIRSKLPFLIDLSSEEKRTLPKLGDKSRAFVTKALEIAQQNPEMLPRSFDLEEMRRDVALFQALQPITIALTQLQELVEDTSVEAGSEAYVAALSVYQYAKAGGQGPALDVLAESLGKRFSRRNKTPS